MKNIFPFLVCLILSLSFFACEKPPVEPNDPFDPTEPAEIEYTLSHTSLDFDVSGGQAEFTVTVKYPAIIESIEVGDSWCRISTTGESVITVTVTVDSHTNYEVRNTSIVVNMKLRRYKASATVQITQEEVKIPEWVLIDGIKWATRNVDMPGTFAAKPEDPGMFYQWNRKMGWSVTNPVTNSDGSTIWDESYPEGNTWEKANDPCPAGWRVPTNEEYQSLANAGSKWTTVNGVRGRVFGSDDELLFLPAVGYCTSWGFAVAMNDYGFYWSNGADANSLDFSDTNVHPYNYGYRVFGYSVRCVAE